MKTDSEVLEGKNEQMRILNCYYNSAQGLKDTILSINGITRYISWEIDTVQNMNFLNWKI